MRQEELDRLQALQDEKLAVQNVRTGHSDLMRIENGHGEGFIVPAAVASTGVQVDETMGRPSQSPLGGLRGERPGYTELDMAITSIMQPKGDEYSTLSSRGPDHRPGPGHTQVEDGQVTEGDETPFELDATVGDAVEQVGERAQEAAQAGQEEIDKLAEAQEQQADQQADQRLEQERATETGTKATPPARAKTTQQPKSGNKSSGNKK